MTETPRILYASGSGVYGDLGEIATDEDYGPLVPVSTYGASKLAGEALISAYATCSASPAAPSGSATSSARARPTASASTSSARLLADPTRLRILGDGTQSKSYIHVHDVVDAVLLADGAGPNAFDVYNVATGDYITVTEIADLAVEASG